jgi:hypothetical protein
MALPRYLIGVGMPAQLAKRVGFPTDAASANSNGGAAFASATAIGQFQFYVRANAQSSLNVYVLPSNAEPGSEYIVMNLGGVTGGVTANVYPPAGGQAYVGGVAGATATLVAIVSGKAATFIAITASTFDAILSA